VDRPLTRYGLGGFHQIKVSMDVVEQVVDAYLVAGGNYIETARGYGDGASEDKIGRVLEGRRDQVILCSKTPAKRADDARRDLEATLKALRTDHIEFYFFHGINEEGLEQITAKGGAVEALQLAVEEGLVGGLGLSSHWPPVYLEAFARIPLSLILIWCNYFDNLCWPLITETILPEAHRRGIAVTAMKPLAFGLLHRLVENAIRYTLGAGADVVVCGTNTPQQVREVAAAARKGPADEALRAKIQRDAPELGRYVCRRCGGCSAELTDTFRLEGMYDRQVADLLPRGPEDTALRERHVQMFAAKEKVQEAWKAAKRDRGALLAEAPGVTCPYGIDVARKVRIATAKLAGENAELI
jgi:predicted aldo/keto reductase-like oxidoreductase